jgi:hypothetical protein
MSLIELTAEIRVLPRLEKLQLIEAISQMLLEEEHPSRYFSMGEIYPVFTPTHQEKAAAQLQQLLQNQGQP